MNKPLFPIILIIASLALIAYNLIFPSGEINLGFWMRISAGVLLIISMVLAIRNRKKKLTE